MYKENIFVFLITFVIYSQALVLEKECPNFTPVDNFSLKALGTGVWHEIARYPNEFQTSNCGTYELKTKGENAVLMQLIGSNIPEDSPEYLESVFKLAPEANNKGILIHEVTSGNPRVTTSVREYILAVDYDKYYIGAECTYDNVTNTANAYAWIVTRSKNYEGEVKEAINNYLKSSKDIDETKLVWLDLEDESCF